MRRQDKYINMEKVNILAEERYLKFKGLLKEEAEQKVRITTSTSHGDLVFTGQIGRLPEGLSGYKPSELFYFKPEKDGFEWIPKGSYKPDWVGSTKEKVDNIVRLGQELPIDCEMCGSSIPMGEPINGNLYIQSLIHGDERVIIEKI